MSIHQFNHIEKETLYKSYEKKCFYCGELIYFRELHIDHVVPEHLFKKQELLEDLKKQCGIPNDFNINSYNNWVPAHARCNLKKAGKPFSVSSTIYYLELINNKLEKILKTESKIKECLSKDIKVARIVYQMEGNKKIFSEIKKAVSEINELGTERFEIRTDLDFADRVYRNWIHQKDLTDMMSLDVRIGSEDKGVELTDPADETITVFVKNCNEFNEFVKRGYYSRTTYDIKMAAYFEKTCGFLAALSIARIPTFRYISEMGISITNYEKMPLVLLESFNPDLNEIIRKNEGKTIRDWINNGQIKVIEEYSTGFHIEFGGVGLVMIELLRADFNSDDIEDVLVYCYFYSLGGTLGYGNTRILTRKDSEGQIISI